ncbi:MAG TPA: hypothetical protein VJ258_01450 [Candidatus Limnocylindrales bacterium]|nr:hypothetical protein [Candidatus Limnocylindrales bacterium]
MIGTLLRMAALRRKPSGSADQKLVAFARGVAMGALLGAAIAGSTIWRRRRRED